MAAAKRMPAKTAPILVTRPALPPFEEFSPLLRRIWDSKWLTNDGSFHAEFERELAAYLGVENLSLFANGTLALITALQALRVSGEVITTPFSFVASTHALHWNGIRPVFCDIDPKTFNLDPEKIEAAITPHTTAILPVHVYGIPCDVARIAAVADRYGLRVIYDACHAFGVRLGDKPLVGFGDLSVMSFHATKVFTTFEGGAIISPSPDAKQHIDFLKNFGFNGEATIVAPGINAKMNEFQAALGILQLKYVDGYIGKRARYEAQYRARLRDVPGITPAAVPEGVRRNHAYFPVLIDKQAFGLSRDELYEHLKRKQIHSRRYFYPLISDFPTYKGLPSAARANLPVAHSLAESVLCLPLYPDMGSGVVERICDEVRGAPSSRSAT